VVLTLPVVSVGAVLTVPIALALTVIVSVANILHVPIAVVWASAAIAIASVVVTVATIVLAGRVVTATTARWRLAATAATRRALTAGWTSLTT